MRDCIDHGQKGKAGNTPNSGGYGSMWCRETGKTHGAHRVVFFRKHGYWPEVVMHICNNPRCINPDHLVAGTQKDNVHMARSLGRMQRKNISLRKLSPEQVRIARDTSRTAADVSAELGISMTCVYSIRHRKTYSEISEV